MLLITGATGFIGSRMAERYPRSGGKIVLLGRVQSDVEVSRAERLRALGHTVHEADLRDGNLERYTDGVDTIIHLAAAQHEANQPASYFEDVNVGGTRNLLEAAVASGVGRFVYGSTIGVYGDVSGAMIDDGHPEAPDNHYGHSKLKAEQLVRSFRDRLEVSVARISETYGPGDTRLLKLFSGIQKGVFFIVGDGQNQHQLLYVDDLLHALHEMATSAAVVDQTVVLAGDEVLTTQQLCECVSQAVGSPLRKLRMPLWPFTMAAIVLEQTIGRFGVQPPLHRRRLGFFKNSYSFSSCQRNKLMEWRPAVSFEQGARLTSKWYRSQSQLSDKRESIRLPTHRKV